MTEAREDLKEIAAKIISHHVDRIGGDEYISGFTQLELMKSISQALLSAEKRGMDRAAVIAESAWDCGDPTDNLYAWRKDMRSHGCLWARDAIRAAAEKLK